jgi:hypothetical protein
MPDLFAAQPDLLLQLATMLSPTRLVNDGVPVYRTVGEGSRGEVGEGALSVGEGAVGCTIDFMSWWFWTHVGHSGTLGCSALLGVIWIRTLRVRVVGWG